MDLLEFSSKFIIGETDALPTFCRLFTENNILYFMLAPHIGLWDFYILITTEVIKLWQINLEEII